MNRGACCAALPRSEKSRNDGRASRKISNRMNPAGTSSPVAPRSFSARPRSTPRAKPCKPIQTPAIKPNNPAREEISPAINLRNNLIGQPIKTALPTIRKTPETSLAKGALPPRERNSRNRDAQRIEPRTKPINSGRRYCIRSLSCKPSAPEVFSMKQETQMPLFWGLPQTESRAPKTPRPAPAARTTHKCRSRRERLIHSLRRDGSAGSSRPSRPLQE